jgi:hypothetical protein
MESHHFLSNQFGLASCMDIEYSAPKPGCPGQVLPDQARQTSSHSFLRWSMNGAMGMA